MYPCALRGGEWGPFSVFRAPCSAIYSFPPPSLPIVHHPQVSADEPNTCVCRLPSAVCPGGRDELGQFVIVFRDLLVYDIRCSLSGSSRYVGNRSGINGSYSGENHEEIYPGVTTGSQ